MPRLPCRYLVFSLLVILLLMVSVTLSATPVSANPGLRVSGAILVADVSPGDMLTHKMTVGTKDEDQPMDILVDVGAVRQSLDGGYQLLQASEDTGPYSARQFITLDKSSFHLEPGDSQDVIATIYIPEDVGAGGRYAVINIHNQPTGQGQIGIVTAIYVLIYLTVKDSQLVHEGKIAAVTASEVVSGQPVDILTTFQNTGNQHFKVRGEVTIRNAQGKTLDTVHLALTTSSVIPTMSRQLKATFIPKGPLALGVYSVKSRLMLEDGTLLDEASGSFEVEKPYVPPPPPASVTLNPSSASILNTGDGRISVGFPQGAVISQVEVSLRSYLLEQLPPPPTGFNPATTCFRIDGLTGLLAKEATVTVKYTTADLDKAGGDASRLRLARWDEAQSQWSVLKTKVDEEATTLTTNTNQLSIWAVMVAPPAHTHVNWPLIGGIIGSVIIIALPVYFLIVRRRGCSTG
jgi:hypothetical protein